MILLLLKLNSWMFYPSSGRIVTKEKVCNFFLSEHVVDEIDLDMLEDYIMSFRQMLGLLAILTIRSLIWFLYTLQWSPWTQEAFFVLRSRSKFNLLTRSAEDDDFLPLLNGRGIYGGGCTPPFTIFFDFRLRSLRYEKDFLPVLSKLSQASMIKIFHFSDEWKVAPQRGVYIPHKSRGRVYARCNQNIFVFKNEKVPLFWVN